MLKRPPWARTTPRLPWPYRLACREAPSWVCRATGVEGDCEVGWFCVQPSAMKMGRSAMERAVIMVSKHTKAAGSGQGR